ncbi:unnamed protein product [Cladocopium goreaui]|uniref:Uncharacterized protein n=2 Tax=Cladocopium goreaui TaxID=2562237 RepID=A0A9P1DJ30_9DINO|nr:unnamed protein product [Cladocopium goreaui]
MRMERPASVPFPPVRQKQSFRVAAKEFAKGPVVIHLTASGDLERLGKSFANHERFNGPRPPEEVLVPFWEKSEEERAALRCNTASARAETSQMFRTISSSRPSREQRRARLAMTCATPLHGVSASRNFLFQEYLQSKGTLTSSRPQTTGLSKSRSAAEILSEPGMSMVTGMIPDRAGFILPSWEDRKQQTRMVWSGMERERWDQLDSSMRLTQSTASLRSP